LADAQIKTIEHDRHAHHKLKLQMPANISVLGDPSILSKDHAYVTGCDELLAGRRQVALLDPLLQFLLQ
jgi:hypothetical protein